MRRRLVEYTYFAAATFLAFCATVEAEGPVKLSIPEILQPETRLHALRAFLLQEDRARVESSGWMAEVMFAKSHADLQVHEIRRPEGSIQYLVTWAEDLDISGLSSWKEIDAEILAESASPILVPCATSYRVFSADGLPVSKETTTSSAGILADLKGDGEWEVLEDKTARFSAGNGDFLQIRPVESDAKSSFAVLYNSAEWTTGDVWSFRVVRSKDGPGYEIQLGPVSDSAGIDPKVSFRWDTVQKAWVGPAQAGDHFRVLRGDEPSELLEKMRRAVGMEPPRPPIASVQPDPSEIANILKSDFQEILPAHLSKPYRYRTLSDASNEQLFTWMTKRRNVFNYRQNRLDLVTSVPDFWHLDPRDAALEYVRRNRPPEVNTRQDLEIFNPYHKAAPEEGSVTFSDEPSGCFAPPGANVHALCCTKAGSCFIYAEIIQPRKIDLVPIKGPSVEFRKLEIPYETARHVLQTIWWMSRIRSGEIKGSRFSQMDMSSTDDGIASVEISTGALHISAEGWRGGIDPWGCRFRGIGFASEAFDQSAFVNLVMQLFRREVPERLGLAWRSAAINSVGSIDMPWTPAESERARTIVSEVLQLFHEHKASPALASCAVEVAGDYGWRDLRPMIERIAVELPPPANREKRVDRIEQEIARYKKELGVGADETSFRSREQRRSPVDASPAIAIPGLEPVSAIRGSETGPAPKVNLLPPEEDAKYRDIDNSYRERNKIQSELTGSEIEIAALRKTVPEGLRKIDLFDQPEQIERWAREDSDVLGFAVARLAKIGPSRAIRLLRHFEETASAESRTFYKSEREQLEKTVDPADAGAHLSQEQRAALIAALRTHPEQTPDFTERDWALAQLVPENDPKRYDDPGINEALIDLLHRSEAHTENISNDIALDLARRLGRDVWPLLVEYWRASPGAPGFEDVLPIMTSIAQRESGPYRDELHDLLAPELRANNGFLNSVFQSIWQLDLRDLKSDLERIATGGPEDYEGARASGGGSQKQDVAERFHRARHILTLWNEEDPLTRARLLVTYALGDPETFVKKETGAMETFHQQFIATRDLLSDAQRKDLASFVDWCEKNASVRLSGEFPSSVKAVIEAARADLEKVPEIEK